MCAQIKCFQDPHVEAFLLFGIQNVLVHALYMEMLLTQVALKFYLLEHLCG